MIKNFPHGFYEKQMFDYFSQFGEVTRLKIARSRKVLFVDISYAKLVLFFSLFTRRESREAMDLLNFNLKMSQRLPLKQ